MDENDKAVEQAGQAVQADQAGQADQATAKMPIKKAIPMVLIAIVMVVGVSAIIMKLNLCIWLVWMGMCIWAAFGMSMNMVDIAHVWVSAACGVALGYMLTSGAFGTTGTIIGFIAVLVFIFGMVSHRFPWFSNNYTAIVLTATTATGMVLEPLQLAESVVFGFLVFGLVPWGAARIIGKKKAAAAGDKPAEAGKEA